MELLDLLLDLAILFAVVPGLDPVMVLTTNDLEHVFSGVLVVVALAGAVALEVAEKSAGLFTDVAEVDGLATFAEEQESVELLEQDSARLVDGAEYSLSTIGQLAEEGTDSPGTLRVQSTSRFVQEEEKLRLRGEFHADCEELALFHVQAFSGDADDCLCEIFHVEHLDDVFDVVILLLGAYGLGLAEYCGEAERFADGGGFEVEILLLDVTGFALEAVVERSSVDEHGSGHDTHCGSLSEDLYVVSAIICFGTV